MRKAATLSSKNQLTIPREVRAALGLKAGETVVFHIEDDGHGPRVALYRNKSLEELAGSVPTPEDVEGLSWEEIRSRAWAPATQPRGESPAGE
jgi:AbrB family looped-hinge helix DNA binding protein